MAQLNVTRYGFGRPQSLNRRLPSITRPYMRKTVQRPGTQPGSRGLSGGFGSQFSAQVQRPAVPPPETGLQTVDRAKAQTSRLQQEDQASVYEADPVLMQIRAMGRSNVAQSRASAGARRRQEVIGFGDENFARQALGSEADDLLLQAIRENSMSTMAQLGREATRETGEAEEGFNKSNLFYGGARIKGLEELGQTQLARSASAQGAVGQRLSAIEEALMAAEQDALQAELDYLAGRQPTGDEGDGGEPEPVVPPPPQAVDGGVVNPDKILAELLGNPRPQRVALPQSPTNSGYYRRFVR